MGDHQRLVLGIAGVALVLAGCSGTHDAGSGAHQAAGPSSAGVFPAPARSSPPSSLIHAWQGQLDATVALSADTPADSSDYVTSGVTVAVLSDRMTWAGASGADGCGHPLDPRAMFDIASITKTFTAAEIVLLAGRGQIDLAAPVSRYVPGSVAAQAGSVRQALGMRNGLRDIGRDVRTYPPADLRRLREPTAHWSPQQTVQFVATTPAPPSDTPVYASVNYVLLGQVIADVTGTQPAMSIRRDLIAKAGLDRVAIQDTERPTPPLASPGPEPRPEQRSAALDGLPCGEPTGGYLPTRSAASFFGLAGGMAADAPDVARWGYELYGGRVLPPSMVAQMSDGGSHPFANTRTRYGLGTMLWQTSGGYDVVGHSGDVDGYSTLLAVVPAHHFAIAAMFPRADRNDQLETLVDNMIEVALVSR